MSENNTDPLYEAMGLVRIVTMDPAGRATLEYRARPEMCHSGGVVQGGFVTGWIDAAMAHAAIAANGPDVTPMTASRGENPAAKALMASSSSRR